MSNIGYWDRVALNMGLNYDPYIRDTSSGWQSLFSLNPAKWVKGSSMNNASEDELMSALTEDIKAKYGENSAEYKFWIETPYSTRKSIVDSNYWIENEDTMANLWGLAGSSSSLDTEQLFSDLGEYANVTAAPQLEDFVTVDGAWNTAKDVVDAENQKLLNSLNQELQNTGDAYMNARNQLLASDFMRNQMTVDAMVSDMSRARRSAIEAGASAGVRIASNVNAIMSAQNKMSQQSLETSNQLAQMLINQRNAESGLHNQWRDFERSTYQRTSDYANTEYSKGESRYNEAHGAWQRDRDYATSDTNPWNNAFDKSRSQEYNKTKNTTYASSGKSAY